MQHSTKYALRRTSQSTLPKASRIVPHCSVVIYPASCSGTCLWAISADDISSGMGDKAGAFLVAISTGSVPSRLSNLPCLPATFPSAPDLQNRRLWPRFRRFLCSISQQGNFFLSLGISGFAQNELGLCCPSAPEQLCRAWIQSCSRSAYQL